MGTFEVPQDTVLITLLNFLRAQSEFCNCSKIEPWIIDLGIAVDFDLLLEYDIGRSKYRAEIAFLGDESEIETTKYDYKTTPVEVVARPSSFSTLKGFKINQKQRLAEFFSRLYPDNINPSLESSLESEKKLKQRYLSDTIRFWSSKEDSLRISFIRTIRIPQDGLDHKLPLGLSKFPLFSVKEFEESFQRKLQRKGAYSFHCIVSRVLH